MITKAIIEGVNIKIINKVRIPTYAVRLPIFHGMAGDGTPSSYLPTAVYCSPPHAEKTQFNVGDIVYVALEDFDLSQIVILGMIPTSQSGGMKGSADTDTSFSIENVDTLKVNREYGTVELPYNIKIYVNTKDDPNFIAGDGQNFVDGDEISYLNNVEGPIQDQINASRRLANMIATVAFSMTPEIDSTHGISALSWVDGGQTIWNEKSGCVDPFPDESYTFTYVGGLWNMRSLTGKVSKNRITPQILRQFYGLTYSSNPGAGANFTINVMLSPLPIARGGTGADNEEDARENLGVFQDIVMSSSDFNTAWKINKNLENRTIYYIHN